MPNLFHLPAITLGQTFGLLLLSRILFGGLRPGGWARKRKEWPQRMAGRIEHLSSEAHEKFRQHMQNRCSMSWRAWPDAPSVPTANQPG